MLAQPKKVDRLRVALATSLAFLAGIVDALGFLALGGFFVSFMTGNTTRLAVGLAEHHLAEAAEGAGILALFITGAIGGFVTARASKGRAKQAIGVTLAGLLLVAAAIHAAGHDHYAAALTAAAMGMENAIFQSRTGKSTGLTYMTGALVQVARHLVEAFTGGPRLAWLEPLLLWLALASGAAVGGLCYLAIGLTTLWPAAALALLLSAALGLLPDET